MDLWTRIAFAVLIGLLQSPKVERKALPALAKVYWLLHDLYEADEAFRDAVVQKRVDG